MTSLFPHLAALPAQSSQTSEEGASNRSGFTGALATVIARAMSYPGANDSRHSHPDRENGGLRRERSLSAAEQVRFEAAVTAVKDSRGQMRLAVAAIQLAAETGIRQHELLSLCWDGVDLEQRVITVTLATCASVYSHGNQGQHRQFALSTPAIGVLRELITGSEPAPSSRVFPISLRTLSRGLDDVKLRSQIQWLRWNQLRYLAVSKWLAILHDATLVGIAIGLGDPGQLRRLRPTSAAAIAKRVAEKG